MSELAADLSDPATIGKLRDAAKQMGARSIQDGSWFRKTIAAHVKAHAAKVTPAHFDRVYRGVELEQASFALQSQGQDLALQAAEYWSLITGGLFASASYHFLPDPLDRLLGYIDFRKALLRGDLPQFTCLVGTMALYRWIETQSRKTARV